MLISLDTASSKNSESMDELQLPEGFRPDFHPKWVYHLISFKLVPREMKNLGFINEYDVSN